MDIIRDTKLTVLRRQGNLHPRPHHVQDALFRTCAFFDPHDLLQVKYEMLRRVRVEGMSIKAAAAVFGLSRPAFYQAQALYQRHDLPGLLRRRPGPRRCHKLSDDIADFIRQRHVSQPTLSPSTLAAQLRTTFDLSIHPRSVERVLSQPGKKTAPHRSVVRTTGCRVAVSRGRSATKTCAARP
jgi:transposase